MKTVIKNEIKLFSMSAEGYQNIQCTAPCTLFSVLLDGGYIVDPLYGGNIQKCRASMPGSCTFSADVEISGNALSKEHVYIRICGIYANAEVIFNGGSYGIACDPNRIYLFDVTDRIKPEDNKLQIVCKEPIAEKRHIEMDGTPSFKYERAPFIGDMGIIGKCEVIFTSHGFISDVFVRQEHKDNTVDLYISADVLDASPSARLVATLVSPSGKLFYGAMSGGECRVTVRSPEYWMPVKFGKPSLYKLSLALYETDEASDIYERQIGLRDLTYDISENGCPVIKIGGDDIFPLGATYVSSDAILSRMSYASLSSLIKNAAESGINTIKISGGGVCPPDFFYSLCDKYGIMVFEDIAVTYLSSFATNRKARETADAVLDVLAKISPHPCVVSAQFSLYQTVGADKPSSSAESLEFFETLKKAVSERAKKYTSAMRFPMLECEVDKYDERYIGDEELSLVALPSETAVESFIPVSDMNLFSPSMRVHGLNDRNAKKMLSEMVSVSKFPTDMSESIYASNITAYSLFTDSVKAARLKFRSGAASAICRQLNDGWPAVSSSFIDWYGEKKALAYAAPDAYSPLCAYARFGGTMAVVNVINGTKKTYEGKLTLALYNVSDVCLFESLRDVNILQGESKTVAEEDIQKFLKDGKESVYMMYTLSDVKGVCSSGYVTPLPYRDMRFCDPKIEASIEGSGKNFTVKLTASAFSPCVRIYFNEKRVSLSDNYFGISSHAPVMIKLQTDEVCTAEELSARLRILTVYDMGNQ